MSMFPPDHALRITLADEVHARPPEPMRAPARASYVAVLVEPTLRAQELQHLGTLCARFGVEPPAAGATHFRAALGALRLKWERHGEFSGYTILAEGRGAHLFAEPPAAALPAGWLAAVPGQTVAAAMAELLPAADLQAEPAALAEAFDGPPLIGADIAEGAARVHTDFRLRNGCTRFVVLDRSLTERQAGRTLQRLFEIEAYRTLALLALPLARSQGPRLAEIESALAALTGGIARSGESGRAEQDESLLHTLTELAAEIESALSASQFRFGACRAYFELVTRRVAELRETRLAGMQTIDEFMARRFTPAVATVGTVAQRLHALSERVAQASALLSTRVDIARERQNQALLASMDRRAKLQLRLQHSVEGFSVAAITYYTAGLVGYLAKAAKAGGLKLDPDIAVGITIPLVAGAVMLAVRRARAHFEADDEPTPQKH